MDTYSVYRKHSSDAGAHIVETGLTKADAKAAVKKYANSLDQLSCSHTVTRKEGITSVQFGSWRISLWITKEN